MGRVILLSALLCAVVVVGCSKNNEEPEVEIPAIWLENQANIEEQLARIEAVEEFLGTNPPLAPPVEAVELRVSHNSRIPDAPNTIIVMRADLTNQGQRPQEVPGRLNRPSLFFNMHDAINGTYTWSNWQYDWARQPFEAAVNVLTNLEYIIVLERIDGADPTVEEDGSFTAGLLNATVHVIAMTDPMTVLARYPIFATNASTEVTAMDYGQLRNELSADYEDGLLNAIAQGVAATPITIVIPRSPY